MKWLKSLAVLMGGVALGWLGRAGVEPRSRDDQTVTASLSQLRADLQALHRAVAARPAPPAGPITTTCAAGEPSPAAGSTEPAAEEAPAATADPDVVTQAESFVRQAIDGRVWTDAHRDRWLAWQGQLDPATRDRLLGQLIVSVNRQELRLETQPSSSF